MPYPNQRYAVYNTLVNEEEPTGFTSIRRIYQEDMAYPCLNFTKTSMTRRLNKSYQEAFIRHIERRLMHILEYYNNLLQEMDDPDINMEEYVQLETKRALRNDKVYNWETATYGKIWYDEDVHYPRFFEIEFLAIVYNDALGSKSDFSSEPTVSPQHVDEISLKNETSLSEYDDAEYNVISYNDLLPFNI
ncbi:hypothetical protein Tco_0296195 [Tanacetum coccineum]